MEEKVAAIIAALRERYPDALCALHYGKDYELMISVRLSAQCTDARVNQVTPALFARFPTLEAFAEADVAEVEAYVRSCGFFRHKAQDIVAACRMLRDEYGGRVPDTMEQLLRLPGVGRKTANLLLGDLYNPRLSYGLRSFPITQGGWFGTQVILGIVSVLPGILISGIILAAMLTAYRIYILVFLGYAFLSFLFFYGAALLCAVCAGNRLGMMLLAEMTKIVLNTL